MTKSFVNKGENKVDGKIAFDSRIKELETKFRDEKDATVKKQKIDTIMEKEPVLLSDKTDGILKGVGVIPGTKSDPKSPVKIKIFDDGVPVIELDKSALITASIDMQDGEKLAGVTYLIPLFEFAVPINYRFQHQLTVLGDTAGLIFFFD